LKCPAASGFWTSASRRNSLHLRPLHRIDRALSRFAAKRYIRGQLSSSCAWQHNVGARLAPSVLRAKPACLLTPNHLTTLYRSGNLYGRQNCESTWSAAGFCRFSFFRAL
jgi:hypothetical protein